MSASPCEIVQGDCIDELKKLAASGRRCKLHVPDPPYNQGMPYEAYTDNKSYDEYMKFTRAWLTAAYASLDDHGSMFVFAPDEWDAEVRLFLKRELKMTERNKIVWTFTFGQACQDKFSRSHCNILYFTKSKTTWTFNADVIRVPSARQAVYGDKRAKSNGKVPDDVWLLHRAQLEPVLTPDRDVWLESRICGTFKARRKHSPNQLPVPLVERIVRVASNPGDLVGDPFLGTGTTAEVCVNTQRGFWGCDLSQVCVDQALARVASLSARNAG